MTFSESLTLFGSMLPYLYSEGINLDQKLHTKYIYWDLDNISKPKPQSQIWYFWVEGQENLSQRRFSGGFD